MNTIRTYLALLLITSCSGARETEGQDADMIFDSSDQGNGRDADSYATDAATQRDSSDEDIWFGICPPDMTGVLRVHFPIEYCIDRWEAHIVDGIAVSESGVTPTSPVSWQEAYEACRAAGKDLCPVEVWHDACNPFQLYPYCCGGYQEGYCNDSAEVDGSLWTTGSRSACGETYSESWDLSGNVFEWVGYCLDGEYPLCMHCGGSYLDSRENVTCVSCSFDIYNDTTIFGSGFRCCRPAGYQG